MWQTATDEFYHTGFFAGGPFSPPACQIPGKRGLCQHEINHRKHLWRDFSGRFDIVFWNRIFFAIFYIFPLQKADDERNNSCAIFRRCQCQLRFIFMFLNRFFLKYFLVLFRLSAVGQFFSLLINHFNKTNIRELFLPP